MFVEYITRYNFNPKTEKEDLQKFRKMLPNWDCEQKGAGCITLTTHEAVFINLNDESEEQDEDSD